MRKPLIGITPSPSLDTLSHGTFQRYTLNAAYADAVVTAGGVPVVLPFQDDISASLLDHLDGVLLSGGADVSPTLFGTSSVHPETYGVSPERDQFELDLLLRALQREAPVLGICRGIQVLNVALGGTLIQDISSEYLTEDPIVHRQQETGITANQPGHTVMISEGNILRDRIGAASLPVNSFHHQAIDRLATSLEPIAHAADGTIEAVVMADRQFVLGVQWHPELMFVDHPMHLVPFRMLIDAAHARQTKLAAAF
ncbi:MAG: gamma-glutamyl-gamma-aminobutyrate hydrolase family protein [Chloroflexota bacterium]|nr:gamma-glutamyl-gamma-aminobutyrate hydrolase family protein [Chloroflexota bacterium]